MKSCFLFVQVFQFVDKADNYRMFFFKAILQTSAAILVI